MKKQTTYEWKKVIITQPKKIVIGPELKWLFETLGWTDIVKQ